MAGDWTATVKPATPGWMSVPADLAGERLEAWLTESTRAVREEWASDWQEEFEKPTRNLLTSAAQNRSQDSVLELLYWPLPRPVVVRVGVQIGPCIPISSWSEAGFEIDAFDGASMGPGVRCIALGDLQVEPQGRKLITAHFVFDDGVSMVQITVEPTLLELYVHTMPAILATLGGVEVLDPSGQAFAPQPVPGYTPSEYDRFAGTDHE